MAAKSTKEIIESGKLKRFVDPRIVKALGHPIREHALAVFNERVASGTDIGKEIDAGVDLFYHHVEELERLGCIERVEAKQRGKEHFFRAKRVVFFDEKAWQRLPALVKADLTAFFLQLIVDDVTSAVKEGTLNSDDGEHVSWTPGEFDEVGWDEARKLMDETLWRLVDIQDQSGERLAKSDKPGIPATVAILGFKTPVQGGASTAG